MPSLAIVKAKIKKTPKDPDTYATDFDKWIAQTELSPEVIEEAILAFKIISSVGLILPYADIHVNSLLLTWNEDQLLLYILITPGRSVRYEVNKKPIYKLEDHTWKFITDPSTSPTTYKEIGLYVAKGTQTQDRKSLR